MDHLKENCSKGLYNKLNVKKIELYEIYKKKLEIIHIRLICQKNFEYIVNI